MSDCLIDYRIVRDLSGPSSGQTKDFARCRDKLWFWQHFVIHRLLFFLTCNSSSSRDVKEGLDCS